MEIKLPTSFRHSCSHSICPLHSNCGLQQKSWLMHRRLWYRRRTKAVLDRDEVSQVCELRSRDITWPFGVQFFLTSFILGIPGSSIAGEDIASNGWTNPDLSQPYMPGPVDVGWEIWVGFAAGLIPFLIGSWEFGKRIIIQQRCQVCKGSGLVEKGRFLRKCPECGGLFPWLGWKTFFTSTAAPGNGGVLRAPRGQTSIFYRVPSVEEAKKTGEEYAAAEKAAATEDVQTQGQSEAVTQERPSKHPF
eukprot:jgi/Botrbrau1/20892/Bobra.0135s0023.1